MAVFFSVARYRMSAPRREIPALAAPRQAKRTSKVAKFIFLFVRLGLKFLPIDITYWSEKGRAMIFFFPKHLFRRHERECAGLQASTISSILIACGSSLR
jgi:hypothetical protein